MAVATSLNENDGRTGGDKFEGGSWLLATPPKPEGKPELEPDVSRLWSRLPVETLTNILSHPDHSPGQLARNSLVNRAVLPSIRRRLYRNVTVLGHAAWDCISLPLLARRTLRAIIESKAVGQHVKELNLDLLPLDSSEASDIWITENYPNGEFDDDDSPESLNRHNPGGLLLSIVRNTPNLTSLTVHAMVCMTDMLRTARPHLQQLESLDVSEFAILRASDFPNLNHLTMAFDSELDELPRTTNTLPTPPSVQHLTIRFCRPSNVHLFHHLSIASSSTLRTLTIHRSHDFLPDIEHLEQLEELSILYNHDGDFRLPALPSSLRTLSVTRSLSPRPAEPFTPLRRLPDALVRGLPSTLHSLNLRNYVFDLPSLLLLLDNYRRLPSIKSLSLLADKDRASKWTTAERDELDRLCARRGIKLEASAIEVVEEAAVAVA